MNSTHGGGRGGPPLGRARRQPDAENPRSAGPEPTLTHRNRLRGFELIDGRVSIELTTELVSIGPAGTSTRLMFVRVGGRIHVADPMSAAVDRWQPSTRGATTEDLTDAIHGSRIWVLLRNRTTAAEAWIAAHQRVDAMPPHGSWQLRQFTIRWGATADFDVLASIDPHPHAGVWDMFTVLDTLGVRTFCSVGARRDRRVDRTLTPCYVKPGVRIDPLLTGLGPRLTLNVDADHWPATEGSTMG